MYNDLFHIGPVTIHGYGLMIGIGFLTAIVVTMLRAKKKGMNAEMILDLALICIFAGFLGAKLLYMIVEWKTLIKDPLSVIGSEGFVVYGGILLGAGGCIFYIRKKKLVFWMLFDLIMPQVALAQAIGRIGCFLAGCCYGAPTDSPLGIVFPEGSMPLAGIKVWPTQLISSAGDLTIAAILLFLSTKMKKKGTIGALYMILYGIGRFMIEFLRIDQRGSVGFLSTSQFISIFIVLGGIAIMVYLFFFRKDKELSEKEVSSDEKDLSEKDT